MRVSKSEDILNQWSASVRIGINVGWPATIENSKFGGRAFWILVWFDLNELDFERLDLNDLRCPKCMKQYQILRMNDHGSSELVFAEQYSLTILQRTSVFSEFLSHKCCVFNICSICCWDFIKFILVGLCLIFYDSSTERFFTHPCAQIWSLNEYLSKNIVK